MFVLDEIFYGNTKTTYLDIPYAFFPSQYLGQGIY